LLSLACLDDFENRVNISPVTKKSLNDRVCALLWFSSCLLLLRLVGSSLVCGWSLVLRLAAWPGCLLLMALAQQAMPRKPRAKLQPRKMRNIYEYL